MIRSNHMVLALLVLMLLGGLFFQGFGHVDIVRAMAFLAAAFAGLWGLWRLLRCNQNDLLLLRPFLIIFFLLLVIIAFHALFLVPLPQSLVAALSPAWSEAITSSRASGLSLPSTIPFAIAPESARISLHQSVAAACVFLASGFLSCSIRNARTLILIIAAISVIEGWLGVFTYLFRGADRAYGGVYNPNHHAALILLGLPLAITMALESESFRGRKSKIEHRDFRLLTTGLICIAALGWLLAYSRGALIAAVLSGLMWIGWEWRLTSDQRPRASRVIGWGFLTACAATPVLFFTSEWFSGFQGRLISSGEGFIGRLSLWKASLTGLADSRFLGMGPGGTEYAINRFMTDVASRKNPIWSHNDFVQFVCDFGVPLSIIAALILVAWATAFRHSMARVMSGEFRVRRRIERAAVVGIGAVLLQSTVDFPLRVPLIGFLFLMLLAYVCTAEVRRERRHVAGRSTRPSKHITREDQLQAVTTT